ncbi:MAG: UDP-N-acetylmuramoyl-L-alanyl-D-glutamate--2,6-diaminopimelate ligase [Pseudomonadota bacterium]
MKLSSLIGEEIGVDPDIVGLASDSREVQPDFLFAALKGGGVDGADYIDAAVERGATAVLCSEDAAQRTVDTFDKDVALVRSDNPRKALACVAASFYPSRPDAIVGVTGTNGKTSTAWFCTGIWSHLGKRAGSIGTLGAISPDQTFKLIHTTPDPITLHQKLSEMKNAGVDRVAMEVSSIGLDQYRADGVRLHAAGFTNISQDHLDYHGSFGHYFDAKKRLFTDLLNKDGVAVVNADGAGAAEMTKAIVASGRRVTTIGAHGEDIKTMSIEPRIDGVCAKVRVGTHELRFRLNCIGAFQVGNALTAAALCAVSEPDLSMPEVVLASDGLTAPPGRMEYIGMHAGGAVYVDYAHTPDALKTALAAARAHTTSRLSVVFGAGGDRDRTKRPEMGRVAHELADRVIVTDDNPRTEDPSLIRSEVLVGATDGIDIGDRREAIDAGIAGLADGDILIVAGKGHEQGQLVNGTLHPFDDASVIRDVLSARSES